jgi:uncharacterized protein
MMSAARVTRIDIANLKSTLERFCQDYDRASARADSTINGTNWNDSQFRRFEQEMQECFRSLGAVRRAIEQRIAELDEILRSIDGIQPS